MLATESGVHRTTVGLWRRRFATSRLAGLGDDPRIGAPRRIGDADVERANTTTLEQAPPDGTHWSTRGLAQAAGLKRTTVAKIWRTFGLPPHRSDRPFLDTVDASTLPELGLQLILDNAATHRTALIQHWMLERPHVHLHFTPTSTSWINLVECWFSLPQRRALSRAAFASTDALGAALRNYHRRDQRRPEAVRLDQDRRRDPHLRQALPSAHFAVRPLGAHQLLIGHAMRLIRIRSLPALQVLDIRSVVPLVPHHLRVPLERQDVRGDAVQEPAVV